MTGVMGVMRVIGCTLGSQSEVTTAISSDYSPGCEVAAGSSWEGSPALHALSLCLGGALYRSSQKSPHQKKRHAAHVGTQVIHTRTRAPAAPGRSLCFYCSRAAGGGSRNQVAGTAQLILPSSGMERWAMLVRLFRPRPETPRESEGRK